jgi:hypothetical protein
MGLALQCIRCLSGARADVLRDHPAAEVNGDVVLKHQSSGSERGVNGETRFEAPDNLCVYRWPTADGTILRRFSTVVVRIGVCDSCSVLL